MSESRLDKAQRLIYEEIADLKDSAPRATIQRLEQLATEL
jgi:hypothetical protein